MGRPTEVYLAGPITGLTYKGATNWREHAAAMLKMWGIVPHSPMRGKQHILKRHVEDKHSPDYEGRIANAYPDAPMSTQKGIVARDRFDVQRSDIVLFYFGDNPEKASIGSCVEYGWADAWRKV